jgi:hypothetical protein
MRKKTSPERKNRSSEKPPLRKTVTVRTGNISEVEGEVNIAARDIVKNIQTIYQRALTHHETVERDLQIEVGELERGVRKYLKRLRQQAVLPQTTPPYKGLEAYTLSDTGVFFGRDRAIRDLREAMKRGRLTILQAESGAGKTSLLQAGIVPSLIREGALAILIRPQFENPSHAIKKCLLGNLELTPTLASAPLVDFLQRVKEIIGRQTTLYLILDQFEEFFAKYTLEEDRRAFIGDLAGCLNDATLNAHWIISITTDAFGQLGKLEPHIRNPFSNAYSLYLFNRQEAAEVIAKPAQINGLSFQEGMLERLLDDLGQNQDAPVAPTQIQLVCLALYDDIRGRDTLFTLECYQAQGGAEGILRGYIGNVLNHYLPPEERAPAYKILEALVTSEKKRVLRIKTELEQTLQNLGIPHELAESTLNHLVNRRLIRRLDDDNGHMQYEIVHDYLLREIEINEDVRIAKETQELLDQGVRNWSRRKLMLAPDALEMVEAGAANHIISSAAAKLLFLSAIEYNRPAERWADLLSAEARKDLIGSLLSESNSRKKQRAIWSLRNHLTKPQRTGALLTGAAYGILGFLPRAAILLLTGVALLVIGSIALNVTLHFVPWTKVMSLNSQCLDGGNPSDLLVAIDARDKSRVVVYDVRSHTLCESKNTGSTWTSYEKPLPAGLTIHSIAVNSSVYLATSQGLYYQDGKSTWRNAKRSSADNSAFREIAVDAENQQIYVSDEQNQLYRYDLTTGSWENLPGGEWRGVTDITANYDYLAISTVDGVWYRETHPDEPWTQFDLKENVAIAAIEMVHPIRSWKHYFMDPVDDDWFLATTEKGEIYFGYLTESGGLLKMDSQTPVRNAPVSSLAVNEYSKFMAGLGGLYCEQSWTILDSEWWLRLGGKPPCK